MRYYGCMVYNTRQKEIIEQAVSKKKRDFSAKELYLELVKAGEDVSQTTIYRVVENMAEKGQLKKTLGPDSAVRYQYLKSCNHFGHCYLKCNQCGRLKHIDCEDVSDLAAHINTEHKFKIDESNIVINGTCRSCA